MRIKNKTELKAKLDEAAVKALTQTAARVKDLWRDLIERRFYNEYTPKVYQRTWQLLESVVITDIVKENGRWSLNIFMDTGTAARGYESEPPDMIWSLAAEGIHGTPGIQTRGRFYDELIAVLNDGYLINEFEQKLQGMGLTVKK